MSTQPAETDPDRQQPPVETVPDGGGPIEVPASPAVTEPDEEDVMSGHGPDVTD